LFRKKEELFEGGKSFPSQNTEGKRSHSLVISFFCRGFKVCYLSTAKRRKNRRSGSAAEKGKGSLLLTAEKKLTKGGQKPDDPLFLLKPGDGRGSLSKKGKERSISSQNPLASEKKRGEPVIPGRKTGLCARESKGRKKLYPLRSKRSVPALAVRRRTENSRDKNGALHRSP